MKICSYCGKEHPDEATACSIDGQPLVSPASGAAAANPKPVTPQNRIAEAAAISSLLAPLVIVLVCLVLFGFLESHGRTSFAAFYLFAVLPPLLLFVGLGLGIFAVVKADRRGAKGAFISGITGICLNGLLLVLLVAVPFILPMVVGRGHPRTPQGRFDESVKTLAGATNEEEKFYALDDAAKEGFEVARIEDARKYATDLLALAPKYKGNWNYGNAIQDGNLVLGRIAVREGRIDEARQYLLAAGSSPGSPQMDSFGPNMSLAKDLLEKGERDVVLQYFEQCRKFWDSDFGKLDEWTRDVKAGRMPYFGANLVY